MTQPYREPGRKPNRDDVRKRLIESLGWAFSIVGKDRLQNMPRSECDEIAEVVIARLDEYLDGRVVDTRPDPPPLPMPGPGRTRIG